jgi:hypothetical protein
MWVAHLDGEVQVGGRAAQERPQLLHVAAVQAALHEERGVWWEGGWRQGGQGTVTRKLSGDQPPASTGPESANDTQLGASQPHNRKHSSEMQRCASLISEPVYYFNNSTDLPRLVRVMVLVQPLKALGSARWRNSKVRASSRRLDRNGSAHGYTVSTTMRSTCTSGSRRRRLALWFLAPAEGFVKSQGILPAHARRCCARQLASWSADPLGRQTVKLVVSERETVVELGYRRTVLSG